MEKGLGMATRTLPPRSGRGHGVATSPSHGERAWDGNEDVAAPFGERTRSGDVPVAWRKGLGWQRGRCRPVRGEDTEWRRPRRMEKGLGMATRTLPPRSGRGHGVATSPSHGERLGMATRTLPPRSGRGLEWRRPRRMEKGLEMATRTLPRRWMQGQARDASVPRVGGRTCLHPQGFVGEVNSWP